MHLLLIDKCNGRGSQGKHLKLKSGFQTIIDRTVLHTESSCMLTNRRQMPKKTILL